MLFHPEMQRLRTALGEPAIKGAGHGPNGVLEEAQFFGKSGVGGGEDESTHDDVRVAVDILGERVHDDVGAEEERGGVERGEEGVVDEDDGLRGVGAGDAGDTRNVDEAECGVCWRFYPYELCGYVRRKEKK
jgi:hypothetical protein